jgi:hypothetical protein
MGIARRPEDLEFGADLAEVVVDLMKSGFELASDEKMAFHFSSVPRASGLGEDSVSQSAVTRVTARVPHAAEADARGLLG